MTESSESRVHRIAWEAQWSAGNAGIHVMRVERQEAAVVHDHAFREIVYIESGAAEHLTAAGGPPQRLRPGDLIVIRPLVWHAYRRPRHFNIINCLFDHRMMRRLTPLLEGLDGAFDLFRRPTRHPGQESPVLMHTRPAHRALLLERFARIMQEQQERSNGWVAAAAAALLDVLVIAARLHLHDHAPPRVHLGSRIAQAVEDTVTYLEAHYTQSLRLAELAKRVSISPTHLSRSFTRRMGIGMAAFVNQLRCEEACQRLRGSDEPISQIATRVGFQEIAYFSRCFRQHVGQSPRLYRKSPPLRNDPALLNPS